MASTPRFIILGAQKCGTTSLFRYLMKHPRAVTPETPYTRFFNLKFGEGVKWYLEQFPELKENQFTGEVAPSYLSDRQAPRRILSLFPEIKCIALIRNPVDRAYSGYQMEFERGNEERPFEIAAQYEEELLAEERKKLANNPYYFSLGNETYNYLERGRYAEQLEFYRNNLSPEQLLVICSEEFFDNPQETYLKTLDFLDLPDHSLNEFPKARKGDYPEMSEKTRQTLVEYFRPHNQRLYEKLGRSLDWDK